MALYITMVLLGAAAAYGVAHKVKPRPGISSGQKKALIACGGVIGVCLMLFLAVALIPRPPH